MQEYLGVHRTGLEHCMHGVFHVVFGYVFHVYDCVIVCYTLLGKHIHGMTYMGNVISWLLRGKLYIHGIMYIGKRGMLRLGTISLGVQKMK